LGQGAVLSRARFPTPASKPCMRLSPHTAPQGLATSAPSVTTGFVRFLAFAAASIVLRDDGLLPDSWESRQLLDQNHVNPLASFPMYAAFPRSEYYDAPDAHGLHRGAAPLPAWASHVHPDALCSDL
jgi:hypothetical protein